MVLTIFKHHIPMWSMLEMLADFLLCVLAVVIAADRLPELSFDSHPQPASSGGVLFVAVGFSVFMAVLYSFVGLYRQGAIRIGLRIQFSRALLAMVMGSCIACLALQSVGDGRYSFLLLMYSVPVMATGVLTVRALGYLGRRTSLGARRVLIVGTGPEARSVASELVTGYAVPHVLVGFYPLASAASTAHLLEDMSAPIFSTELPIDELALKHRVDEIIVAVREQRGVGLPMDQLLASRIRGIPVIDLAAFCERTRGEVPTESLKASWLVYGHGFVQGGLRTAIKRDFDIAVSLLLLTLTLPIMLLTAIAIKLESRGPILYLQERVGLRGRSFMCPKFRSMSIDAEKDGVARWATKNDSRVTRVGAVIRACRIDELPQLVSVLRGEMSLVGPRPERPTFVRQLQAQIPFYDIRHSVKPGVTGWAQVRYSYGASIEDARRKHQFDLYYVKNHSLFLDLLVMVETVSVVLFREGAR
jgi:sugar transferase (PEP-CTERM system associated)